MKVKFWTIVFALLLCGCGGNSGGSRNAARNAAANSPATAPAAQPTTANTNGSVNQPDNAVTVQKQLALKQIETPEETNFTAEGLPAEWQWLDPDGKNNPTKYETKNGFLHLEVPSGKDLYGETRTAPRLYKVVLGDFEIETHLRFDPQQSYQGAGILIFSDDKNFLRLERGKGGIGADESGVRFDKSEDGNYSSIAPTNINPTAATEVKLKIRRAGNDFAAFWREPNGEWKEAGKAQTNYGSVLQIGLIACNTAQPFGVDFQYVKLAPVAK